MATSTTAPAADDLLSKVPAVTFGFWVIKICATTVGETGGDAVSMSLNLGYAVATLIFLGFFVVTLALQLRVFRIPAPEGTVSDGTAPA